MKPTIHFMLHEFDSLDSTNTTAREMAANGAPEGTVVLARGQRQGRGRFGRTFFSPDGSGIYMSVILRPTENPLYITTAAAVAVAGAMQAITEKTVGIKWVNDVYCDGKKACGILTEGVMKDGLLCHAVLGIGVNLAFPQDGFPEEISNKAGSVLDVLPAEEIRHRFIADVLERFAVFYENLSQKPFLEEYRKLSLLTDKTVKILAPSGEEREAVTVLGIDDEFALVVKQKDGTVCHLSSGEVSIKI